MAGAGGGSAGAAGGAGGAAGTFTGPFDSGRPVLRRLTNLEYDLTVRDLLGVPGQARATFESDEVTAGFDVIGDGQAWVDARFEEYFDSAETLAAAAFADPMLRARIVTCSTADTTCLTSIVTAFGLRAWRRPLTTDEVSSLVGLAQAAILGGATVDDALQRVVTALMSSAPFLMHVELDPMPESTVAHALTPYELVSRLSYLLWSSMPDDRLLQLAGGGLLADAALEAEVDRMIADPRADGFVEGFAAEWLDFERLANVQLDPTVDAIFDSAMRDAMGQELRQYTAGFLDAARDFTTFPSADLGVIDTNRDGRVGFLGLPGFLTMTSPGKRSSPTERGEWILEHLLCEPHAEPPAGTPDFINRDRPETGRALVDSIHAQASCAGCHDAMDGAGVALEAYDELGRFRTTYGDGTAIDAHGTFAGQPVNGEAALAAAVGGDPRLLSCVSRKLLSFAVNRALVDSDTPYANQILTQWKAGSPSLRALIKAVVTNDTFKFRRGEAP
jgi:hypothetical protein